MKDLSAPEARERGAAGETGGAPEQSGESAPGQQLSEAASKDAAEKAAASHSATAKLISSISEAKCAFLSSCLFYLLHALL